MATLAKLSRPRLAGIHPRERLFARLDDCRRRAAVWISGPPGAGKTTLAASYLDARGLRALWYQVDAGDADPSSFIYHLGVGARAAGLSKKTHLPLLTPEYLPDLAGFARRWFRMLYQGLPQGCLLVFDNVQEAATTPVFAALLRDALVELPEGTNAILVSREEPPAEHARLRASRALAEIGWDELQLTEDEASSIATNSHHLEIAQLGSLVRRCGGWAAGLTLLLDHARARGAVADAPRSRQALFDYFAAELFDRLSLPTRNLLLRTALLPWVDMEMARALSGSDDAAALLESLRRRHMFTERRAGADGSYQYHALFREFLHHRLAATLSPSERQRLAQKSAQLLARAQQIDAALRLYLESDDPDAAAQLVLASAPGLAAQGRLQTVAEWISALPADAVDALPWLGYWQALCDLPIAPSLARARWERVFERFAAAGDELGQAVTASGIIDSYLHEYANFRPTDPWIAHLRRLFDRKLVFPDPGLELTVLGSLVAALVMRNPDRMLMAPYVSRARSLVEAATDVNSRVGGGCRLLFYYVFVAEVEAAGQLIASIRPQLSHPRLSPHLACQWLDFQALYFQVCRYDAREGNEAMQAALDLAERHGLRFLRGRMALLRLECDDVEGAAWQLAQPVQGLDDRRFDVAWHIGLRSWIALLRGDATAAVAGARHLVAAMDIAGVQIANNMGLMLLANALFAAGQYGEAIAALREFDQPHRVRNPVDIFTARLIEADVCLASGDAGEADRLLREAFALAHRERLFNTMQWLSAQMSRLCAFALQRDIEPTFVAELIRLRGLRPPSPDVSTWPWPLKIRTLGAFAIENDEQPLRFEGKAQRKPLALLKVLIALGATDVPEDELIGIVWADGLDGDAQKAFDVTLHRLRKLLGHDKAIVVGDRRVSLNRELVWADLWTLERRLTAVVPVHASSVPESALEEAAPVILELNRGAFLQGEPDAAWLLPVRNRLAGRFQRFVLRLGEQRELQRRWADAAELYERAIELEPLGEVFYARLMVCLREQGRRAEAIEAFRRCRQLLSITLNVQPSENTQALYRELNAPEMPHDRRPPKS